MRDKHEIMIARQICVALYTQGGESCRGERYACLCEIN